MEVKTELNRAVEIYHSRGISGLAISAGRFIKYHTHLPSFVWQLIAYRARRDIEKLPPLTPAESVDYIYSDARLGLFRREQKRSEILQLLELVHERQQKTVLEIGTATGATLFLFARNAHPKAHIISIDLPGGKFGGGYPEWKWQLYKSLTLLEQKIRLIRDDSHDSIMWRGISFGIDFLFIDGDHSYEGVKQDFEMYSPLVRKGGIIAIHDIVPIIPGSKEEGCEVSRFWNEIKTKNKTQEIVEDWNQGSCGIGILYV